MLDTAPAHAAPPSRLRWAGFLLGFAIGGFFDGILLHQILQWHHLLSAVEGAAFRDIRVQILADGLFHAIMYVVAAAGLWLLWRSRRAFAGPGADRRLFADALIGFGVWHVVDGILSHWILGIHRIRMESASPLLWDLLWFVVFGVLFIAAGLWLHRRGGTDDSGGGDRRTRRAAPAALAAAVLVAGPLAALPPPDVTIHMVLFRPGTAMTDVAAAVDAVDGRLVWGDGSGQLWAIDVGPGGSVRPLYRHGALLVSNGILPAGCFDWLRV
ncbi:DUF2243 domain-containing protein [Azospirillum halopraeferens]|uniref:DUF2243 domain-containing protein n=1 Tax=Azospirillum halopraeferens TaxID=34010 RepID=UPI00041749F4|nr:DUF2243 domain-containing protein [Azospirillum halopraeferens]